METLRLLHMADVHLDTPFYGRDELLRRKLRDACREAFKRAVDAAIKRNVHAFLIAGDLFDNELLSFTTERFLLDEMCKLQKARIPVFYATGNHDPGRASYRAQKLEWPSNVHLFTSTTPETVPIVDHKGQQIGWLTAAGHSSTREGNNLAARYKKAKDDLPHVAMLHTQVVNARGADQHERYAPCTEEDLKSPGYDYWALGHVHLRQRIFEDLPAWYAGNLQGRNPKETGLKGALYVEVSKRGLIEPEFIPLSPLVWDHVELACLKNVHTVTELTSELTAHLHQKIDLDDNREHLVRIDLTGESPLADEMHKLESLQDLEETVQNETDITWLEIRPRSLVRPVDVESFVGSPTVLGKTLELLEKLPMDDELLDRITPKDLARSDTADVRHYLRELASNMDREAASLLVPEQKR
ncbi:MAG: DNA repair exonuclease [Candidatus Bipolaricaulota bacterium]|nr:DNA repair exonuclease [Candidatus Bipolaricaulota bacterium]